LALARKLKCESCGKRLAIFRRADALYCSTACRQQSYRQRKREAAAIKPQKAHQRIIRDRLAIGGTERATDIRTAQVRPITTAEAKAIILQYEWLGTMPAVVRHCYGIFFAGELGGAVVYAAESGENLGVWDRFGFAGKIIALARGASLPWAHPYSASKLIRRSMDLLPERYKVVTATVDFASANEVGIVYQSAGFTYCGIMRQGGRALIRINGTYVSERQAGRLAGTQGARALAALGFDAVPVPRRGRYFAFRGSKHDRRCNSAAIAHLVLPYPKRVGTEA
jgi:hypothetical protein